MTNKIRCLFFEQKVKKNLSNPFFHSVSEFLSSSYKNSGALEWTLIRKVYDWRAVFDPVKCDISGYSSARIFRFIKNQTRVEMWYKTNTTENEWRGFQYKENGVAFTSGISVCNSYTSTSPSIIPPRQLDIATITVLAKEKTFLNYYDEVSKNFWNDLLEDSTKYLSATNFPDESKFFNFHFTYTKRNSEIFTSW